MLDRVSQLVVAAPHSGSGKTTITTGLIAALVNRGLRVQPFKVGPDYIDPSYHTLAAGRVCRNLDTWMLPEGRWLDVFDRATRDADCAVIEGVMGVFDGARYDAETGSTAEVAKQLGAPVVIVMDTARMARSAGALALGLLTFDRELDVAGFIANQVGSESHGRGVASVIEAATGKPCFGWIPTEAALSLPERHLGLIPTSESGEWRAFVRAAGSAVEKYLNVGALLLAMRPAVRPRLRLGARQPVRQSGASDGPVIAVARDEAFSFLYPENLELLIEAGGHIVFFSPLRDSALPVGTRGLILSGGFPEVYAAQLSANERMRAAVRAAHQKGLPLLAECGGLMYLTEAIRDLHGTPFPMVGLLPGESVMTSRLTIAYRTAQAAGDGPVLAAGETVRGHEFHYSVWDNRPADLPPAFWLLPPAGTVAPAQPDGARLGNLWATYVHTHFLSAPSMAARFVAACREATLQP